MARWSAHAVFNSLSIEKAFSEKLFFSSNYHRDARLWVSLGMIPHASFLTASFISSLNHVKDS